MSRELVVGEAAVPPEGAERLERHAAGIDVYHQGGLYYLRHEAALVRVCPAEKRDREEDEPADDLSHAAPLLRGELQLRVVEQAPSLLDLAGVVVVEGRPEHAEVTEAAPREALRHEFGALRHGSGVLGRRGVRWLNFSFMQ